jgi:hypothetical protein
MRPNRISTRLLAPSCAVLAACIGSIDPAPPPGEGGDDWEEPEPVDPVLDDAAVSTPDPIDAGVAAAEPDATAAPPPGDDGPDATATDRFGVRKVYPTISGVREWFLPADAERANPEWSPSNGDRGRLVRTDEAGVFRVRGGPRLPVKSPSGRAWFRNVEVTAYYRYRSSLPPAEQQNPTNTFGYQILVRGEAHRTGTIAGNRINDGVPPPAGTVAGPGYPFGNATVNAHCLAASLHGYVDIDGRVRFKKEVSHTAGYTGERARVSPFGGRVPTGRWFGTKYVVRNLGSRGVHMELWMDLDASGQWRKVTESDDTGGWRAEDGGVDDCAAAPFRYAPDQRITWAGPSVLFRFDNIETDVRWLSVREIAPLP